MLASTRSTFRASPLPTSQRTFSISPDYPLLQTLPYLQFPERTMRLHLCYLVHLLPLQEPFPRPCASITTPPRLRYKPRSLSSPLQSPGSTQAWVLRLVPLETKLPARRGRLSFILHLLFRTHGLGTEKRSKTTLGDRTSELKPRFSSSRTEGMPEPGLPSVARYTAAFEKRQHPELPVLRPGKEAASLLSAARGPGGAKGAGPQVTQAWPLGSRDRATFSKRGKNPTTSAGPRDGRARTGKGRTGRQEELEGPVPRGK